MFRLCYVWLGSTISAWGKGHTYVSYISYICQCITRGPLYWGGVHCGKIFFALSLLHLPASSLHSEVGLILYCSRVVRCEVYRGAVWQHLHLHYSEISSHMTLAKFPYHLVSHEHHAWCVRRTHVSILRTLWCSIILFSTVYYLFRSVAVLQ